MPPGQLLLARAADPAAEAGPADDRAGRQDVRADQQLPPVAAAPVVVGIDAGGSVTRARAVAGHRLVFERTGGPGNPLAADEATLRHSYGSALAGCPEPTHVAACVSGAGGPVQRELIAGILASRFPGAVVNVLPDYCAAWAAAPEGTDVVVIAGTGSLVCSAAPDEFRVSGGRGWLFGDQGSAARLGRSALEWFCEGSTVAGPEFTAGIEALFGHSDWRGIVFSFQAAPAGSSLAARLAQAAPLLTRAAQEGATWAIERLDIEMTALAVTTCGHIRRYLSGTSTVRIALAGGVWTSEAARAAFAAAMNRQCELPVLIVKSSLDPVAGAARLAESMSR